MLPGQESPRTAFAATERMLRSTLADTPVDAASFERRLTPCLLARCGGTCCAEGVSLNGEEALVLTQLTRKHAAFFRELLPDMPEPALVREDGVQRTAKKPRDFHGRVPDYPPHFPDTACAFLTEDARCALQCLAVAEGKHPWAYKPVACWLHPISISPERIALPDENTDPYPGGFASQTHCGRSEACGSPARQVLAPELEFLGQVLGRDLLGEIRAGG